MTFIRNLTSRFSNKIISVEIDQVNLYSGQIPNGKFVLVTNGKINSENLDNSRITIIDRNGLKKIANNYRNLIELINTTPNNGYS